jgi:hypothetical protein
MKMLVIGSCTGRKDVGSCPFLLSEVDFDDPDLLHRRESALDRWMKPAASMYTGRQHTQMMAGVRLLRSTFGQSCCDVAIISAGYGLIGENERIAPYSATFQHKPKSWIRKREAMLGLPEAIRTLISEYALVFVLLGDEYLLGTNPPLPVQPNQTLIYFGSPKHRSLRNKSVVIVPSAQREASRFHDGIMTLKGRMFYLLSAAFSGNPSALEQMLSDKTERGVLSLIEAGQRNP